MLPHGAPAPNGQGGKASRPASRATKAPSAALLDILCVSVVSSLSRPQRARKNGLRGTGCAARIPWCIQEPSAAAGGGASRYSGLTFTRNERPRMDFDLPKEVNLIRRTVREFAEQTVAPLVPQMEETDEFPAQLIGAMGELGLLGLVTPVEYGGSNLGYLARTVAVEEVSRVSAAAGICLQVHHMEVAALMDSGTEEQKSRYLPALSRGDYLGTCAITEPTGGSDLLGMASTARPTADGYVLNGRKCFITNCHRSDAVMVVAKTAEGPKGISAFVVEKGFEGFSPGRHEHKMGLRGSDTGEVVFKDCRVPRENLVGNEGDGMTIALKTISEVGRAGMAATSLGILQACHEE
ncbi:MAG: hypothetical protein FJW35_03185, partial [Acidobacteria bacterium]|nr:hypothetical protein [Acidobacteriota bacterium]